MKKIYIYLQILILTAAFVMLNNTQTYAATKKMTIDVDQNYDDFIFYITWENEEEIAKVEIISPDKKTYSDEENSENVYESNGEAIVNVGTAKKGTWTVNVTGNKLGEINVSAGQTPQSMVIEAFDVKENSNKYIAEYEISDCPDEVYIEVFADKDDSGYDGERIYGDTGKSKGKIELDISALKSGEYHFYLRVSNQGMFKREYSKSTLSYQNPNASDEVQGVTAGKYDEGYYISWLCENENEMYKVFVWDENLNLIAEEQMEGKDFYYGSFDKDAKKIYIAVIRDTGNDKYTRFEVENVEHTEATVTFDVEENATNHQFITADVQFSGNYKFNASINDTMKLENQTESGKYKINLNDGNNNVLFLLMDESGNINTFTKEIYVDTVAPALSVSKDVNNTVTSDKYIYVSGYSEAGASLTLNNEEVTMKQGYFNEKVSLEYGDNDIKLVATDTAGNTSQYTATVTCKMEKASQFKLVLYISIAAALLVIYILVFIFGIRRKKKAKKS